MFSCKLFLSKNNLNFWINFSIVNEKICTFTVFFFFPFKIILKCRCHSSKALSFNTVYTEKTDKRIIELKPFIFLSFNERNVMSWFGVAYMHNDASQLIIVFTKIFRMLLRRLLSVEMFQCIRINIEFDWKLMFCCNFFIDESVQIKYDSLKVND